MKAKKLIGLSVIILGGLIIFGGLIAFGDSDDSVESVPAQVGSTIDQHAEGGEILEIEKEYEDGQEVYSVEVRKDGDEVEFMVGIDGAFLGYEKEDDDDEVSEITAAELPASVLEAVKAVTLDKPIRTVERKVDEGVVSYEVEYMDGDMEHSITCAESGEFIKIESEIAVAKLPDAVRRELKKDFPEGQIKEVEAVQSFYYEVEVIQNGKMHKVRVLATGDIEDMHDDDDDDGED